MNLAEIHTFLAIIETGQLNKAALQLNITQSTVTARLNSLEQKVGQPLFHRRKSGAELTSAGFRFERYAQLMVDVWRQARQETALPHSIDSVFNFGCHPDLWSGFGEKLLKNVRSAHSNVAISSWSGEQMDLDKWLGTGLIDIAICHSPAQPESCSGYRIQAEKLVLVSTQPRELMRWDPGYVYVDSGEEFRKRHAAAYPDGDTPTMIFGSAVWARQFLLENQGSGYLPMGLVEKDINQQRFFPVPGAPVFERSIYLVVNNMAASGWPWFDNVLQHITREDVVPTRDLFDG